MKRRAPTGFTLTELLVTVAIIAGLSGIVIPVSVSMVAKSREAACLGKLRAIGIGLQGYLQDHNQKLPELAIGRADRSDGSPVLETVLLDHVAGDAEAFHCPADKREFEKTGSSYHWNLTQNGRHISQVSFLGIDGRPEAVPLVSDKESWHPKGTNFLYADSSSSNQPRFVAESKN